MNALSRHITSLAVTLLITSVLTLFTTQSALAAGTDDFITVWKTNNSGTGNSTSITIPMVGGPYDVDWTNDGTFDDFGVSGSQTHNYGVAGTYTVRIQGVNGASYTSIKFPLVLPPFSTNGKILDVIQWGTQSWISMDAAFLGLYQPCSNGYRHT